ncbi:hypothetical protein AALB_2726 [Agarivorans albus MKT 106]|uniref:Uncharacterized protein n=1 Tax=Agarivorans albus MKT 106 TaxID=1331007 RepID=R9PTL8_AGAAL|nr:hypothetical protein AALB_2726 [Agarivorans albus MKT 106]
MVYRQKRLIYNKYLINMHQFNDTNVTSKSVVAKFLNSKELERKN